MAESGWCTLNSAQRTGIRSGTQSSSAGEPVGRYRLVDPRLLFIVTGVVVLAIIWGATLHLVSKERAAAARAAAQQTEDMAETYEARVVRAFREIDQALRMVRYNLESGAAKTTLQDLEVRGLLPPDRIFTVMIAGADGDVLASTDEIEVDNVGSWDVFTRSRDSSSIAIGSPRSVPGEPDAQLTFARRLRAAGGGFGGIVAISVSSGYFVGGFEREALGDRGTIGVVGSDGVFLTRRTGDTVSAGGRIDYDALASARGGRDLSAMVRVNGWDGVARYTVVRQIFGFPAAVVVGLSEAEKLASVAQVRRTYVWRATGATVVVLAVVAILGRLSSRLEHEQTRLMQERETHARRVEYLAYYDNLTELPNRELFTWMLAQEMGEARRYGRRFALLFIDLDRFKAINDSLGHEAGDNLLREMAQRLQSSVRESDLVARLGGDEFVVLLPEAVSRHDVARVAEKVQEAASRPFTLAGHEFRVTLSIGVGMFPEDGEDEETLIKNADAAMYHAKAQGKNNVQEYSTDLNVNSLERLTLESSLRNALERGELRLFYQAKRALANGRIMGMEALLRWQHPDLGLIEPMEFIPLAEETGLIIPIERWVLRSACQQNVAWQKEGLPGLSVAVNLSPRQFLDETLLEDVETALSETGLDPDLLEVEVTESMVMRDLERTIGVLRELKRKGIRVAIDNFGTGYSSLSTLKDFPIDTIKVDRSFIRDVVHSEEDRGLTEAVIRMGRTLSLSVIAEGVETAEQIDFLRGRACHGFQGFYANEPMAAAEFGRLVLGGERSGSAVGRSV